LGFWIVLARFERGRVEVGQKESSAARNFVFAVIYDSEQTFSVFVYMCLIFRIRVDYKRIITDFVTVIVKHNTLRRKAVSTRPSLFLVETFHAFGDGMVKYEPNVGFIDPHPKRNGCHNNLRISSHPGRLNPTSLGIRNTSMVGAGGDSGSGQIGG
jgi:hypothetical protein